MLTNSIFSQTPVDTSAFVKETPRPVVRPVSARKTEPGIVVQGAPHGKVGGYSNHQCRCLECRSAWAAYKQSYRKRTGRK